MYESEDGKVFSSEDECIAHEKKITAEKKRYEGLNIYSVNSCFDSTEGRGYYKQTYIITDMSLSVVSDYVSRSFGELFQPWYGDGFYEAWNLFICKNIKVHDVLKKNGKSNGYGHHKTEVIFLSEKPLEGMIENTNPKKDIKK